jgi:Heterokaryon incompatibility protein (HET)
MNLSLVEKHDNDKPRYAILSHIWGADGDEVTCRYLTEGTPGNKAGREKIEFCRAQAACGGLQYLWVDTCCIDKSSSAEHSWK